MGADRQCRGEFIQHAFQVEIERLQIQFLRFRYWDGSTWSETWSAPDLPIGVEVSLGGEPLPPESTAEEYPFELYRRVIYLPNHAFGRPPSAAGPAITQVTR